WLGPGAITTDLSDGEIRKRVEAAIADVPYAVGMNNHMGSKATADERVMRIVLGVCREHGLFFLDSRTAWKSVIPRIGEELGVPVIRNSVFLDDVYTTSHIAKQLSVFDKRLNEQGTCIAIGHVGPQGKKTAAALSAAIPGLKRSTTFVRASDVVRRLLRDQLIIPNGISDGGGNPLLLARVD
ncbi:divergent polysaccharide deacetylase family protein, partial [Paenibacillus darwinianus]